MDTRTYSQSYRPQGQEDRGDAHCKEVFGVMCSWAMVQGYEVS